MAEPDYMALFSGDDSAAGAQAKALADAIARRRSAGTLGLITGDPAMGRVGQQFSGDADKLEQNLIGAAQHRAQQQAMQQHYSNELEKIRLTFGQRQGEVFATHDAYGNPVVLPKYGGTANLPQVPQSNTLRGQGGGGGGGPLGMLNSAALDQAAEMYAQTGKPPAVARGKAGAAMLTQIANRAAQLHPDANLAGNQAGYGATRHSLDSMRKQADATNAFESTALANLEQFLGSAKGMVDTGSPLFNAPARKFEELVAGDPRMAQVNAARQVAVQEISKVLGGSMGSAGVSDSARHEASSLLRPDASLAQIEAAAKVLRTDMENRKASYEKAIAEIQGRAGGKAPAPAPAAGPLRKTLKNGKTYEKRGDEWHEVTGG